MPQIEDEAVQEEEVVAAAATSASASTAAAVSIVYGCPYLICRFASMAN